MAERDPYAPGRVLDLTRGTGAAMRQTMTLRRLLPLLLIACMGCLTGRGHERDPRLSSEISRQERWAQDSVAGRATPEDLEKIRSGDQETVNLGRKQLRKLIASVDRGTWIRDAVVESLRDDGDDPALAADFEKAGQTRTEALQAADDLALALAETRGGLALADLRKAHESLHHARDGENRLARTLGAAATARPAQGSPAAAGKASVSSLAKLSTIALPVPKPFIAATARYLYAHPDEKLTGFAADDAAEIRAHLADLENHPPEGKPSRSTQSQGETGAPPAGVPGSAAGTGSPTGPGAESTWDADPAPGTSPAAGAGTSARGGAAPTDGSREHAGGASTMTIANDAQKLIARRGPPRSFATRPDGLFALRYEEKRSCAGDNCVSDVDYLFDASGKLVREESTPRR